MSRRTALPIDLVPQPFSVADATAKGISKGRLRASDLERPFHGVRRVASGLQHSALLAYRARMTPGQFFSHVTAAQLWGLPLPPALEGTRILHVCVFKPDRAPRIAGVIGHHAEPASVGVVEVRGLRISGAVETWCQLAIVLTLDELIIMGDALVRRTKPLATIVQLRRAVTDFSGQRGARRLRDAFDAVRARTDSPRETTLRLLIVRDGLPEPAVNPPMLNSSGEFMAFGDLVYRKYRVLIEYDGAQHRIEEEQYHRDIDRLDDVMEEGWRVVRVNTSHLTIRRAFILGKIRRALMAAGWRP